MAINAAREAAAKQRSERRKQALDEFGRFLAFFRDAKSNESADYAINYQAETSRGSVKQLHKVWTFNYSDALTAEDWGWIRSELNRALHGFAHDAGQILGVPPESFEVFEGFERNGQQYRILVDFNQSITL